MIIFAQQMGQTQCVSTKFYYGCRVSAISDEGGYTTVSIYKTSIVFGQADIMKTHKYHSELISSKDRYYDLEVVDSTVIKVTPVKSY